jgi:O-antigen/teichoic acid export membrane protein
MTFIGLFYGATFPVISRLLDRDDQAVRVILAMSLRIITTLVLPATIAISLLAPQFVGLLFGQSFTPGALALSILVWTVALSGYSLVYSQTVLVSRHKVVYAVGTAIGAALNTALNFLLIPRWSLNGAAAATVATELALLIYFAIYCNRRVVNVPLERRLVAPVLLSLALIPLFIWSRAWPMHFLISGTAIGTLYFFMLFVTRAVTRHDITDVVTSLRSKEPRTP